MNIYALSSGRGPSGIAIIRLSGKDTLKFSQSISKKKNLKQLTLDVSNKKECKIIINSIINVLFDI